MAEYIELDAAIAAIAHRPHVKGWDDYEDGICRGLEEAVNAICAIPAADVRPVVRNEKKILDVTCGNRQIWFQKNEPHTIYCDRRREEHQIETNNGGIKRLNINPDVLTSV